jgi:hypothetical protein
MASVVHSPDNQGATISSGSFRHDGLVRDGRLTLSMSLDEGMCELRMRARKCGQGPQELPLAFLEAEVERVRMHVAAYADVTSGISFALHEPSAVLARWQRQLAALRALSRWGRGDTPWDVVMRAFKTLREFLQLLETEKQLLRISEEVRLEPDLAAAARAITQLGETSPAIHFDRIKGYQNGEVVMNVHGSWPNLALILA